MNESFEYEWIFGFQLEATAARFCPCTLQCSSEVARVKGKEPFVDMEDPLGLLVANFDGGYCIIC